MRKSNFFLIFIFAGILLCLYLAIRPALTSPRHTQALAQKRLLVEMLQLTDLCLFTEARYTRHLSQADLYSAFQDHPMSFEHFPSGALTTPPVLHAPPVKMRRQKGSRTP